MRLSGVILVTVAALSSSAVLAVDVSQIYGKIQIVDSFPDYKVQVVDAFEDLDVQKVDAFADSPGQWQIVDSFPDYKIQIVDSFPDFTIKYVEAFLGHRKYAGVLATIKKGASQRLYVNHPI